MKMPLEEFVYIHENEEITLRDYLSGSMNIDNEGTARWRVPPFRDGGQIQLMEDIGSDGPDPDSLPIYLSSKDLKEFERQYLEYSKRVTSHLIENINYIRAESI